jgi:hypothetical protein
MTTPITAQATIQRVPAFLVFRDGVRRLVVGGSGATEG